jgi:hypothetical protein
MKQKAAISNGRPYRDLIDRGCECNNRPFSSPRSFNDIALKVGGTASTVPVTGEHR